MRTVTEWGEYESINAASSAADLNEAPVPPFVQVSVDYRRSIMWIRIAEHGPAFVSQSLLDDLVAVCRAVKNLPASPFRIRVLASERPGVFSLGGDLAFFAHCIKNQDRDRLARYAHAAIDAIWEAMTGSGYSDMCSISLVQGEAQGGGFEAALAGHVIIAEKGAHFGFPESLFGLFPGMGAFHLLAARVSPSVARQLIGSGRRYTADHLHQIGVIDILAEPGTGAEVVDQIVRGDYVEVVTRARSRYHHIDKATLIDTVDQWVDQALDLTDKHLRTIGYILQAQERHSRRSSDMKAIATAQGERRALA